MRRRIADTISKFRHSVVKVSKVDSHSEVIKVSKAVKVVNLIEFAKDLRGKVVPASKVVKVVKLRGQEFVKVVNLSECVKTCTVKSSQPARLSKSSSSDSRAACRIVVKLQ